jgi:hypothetical protein
VSIVDNYLKLIPPLLSSVDIFKEKVLFPSSIEVDQDRHEEDRIFENLQNEENWILSALQDRVKV